MQKTLLSILIFLSLAFTNTAFAIKLYEKPNAKAKVIEKVKKGKRLIPFYADKKRKDWLKVANPQSGNVGWVKTDELKGPTIFTKINGSEVQQQVIVDGKEKDSSNNYTFTQYTTTSNKIKPKDKKKIIKEMEKEMKEHNKEMRQTMKRMEKMRKNMLKDMQKMLGSFD